MFGFCNTVTAWSQSLSIAEELHARCNMLLRTASKYSTEKMKRQSRVIVEDFTATELKNMTAADVYWAALGLSQHAKKEPSTTKRSSMHHMLYRYTWYICTQWRSQRGAPPKPHHKIFTDYEKYETCPVNGKVKSIAGSVFVFVSRKAAILAQNAHYKLFGGSARTRWGSSQRCPRFRVGER